MGDQELVSSAPEVRGFAPVWRSDARVLVLGSMPGVASLTAAQYYAHPRNAFWTIMGALFGAGPALPYAERLQRLLDAGVALWDVIASCRRPGSLDSAIAPDSVTPNDLPGLITACPALDHLFFNGTAAETAFRRHFARGDRLRVLRPTLKLQRLPSTSPAHAARPLTEKLSAWEAVRAAASAHPSA